MKTLAEIETVRERLVYAVQAAENGRNLLLQPDEADLLDRILSNYLLELHSEIGHTDRYELRRAGLIQENGRLLPPEDAADAAPGLAGRVRRGPSGVEFVLAHGAEGGPDVTLGQRDVRELQLARGALRAGIDVLLARLGKSPADIERVYLAGAFGTYVGAAAAQAVGLIPPVPLDRVASVGNAAGRGSLMALASTDVRRAAEQLARRIEYVELSSDPGFTDAFMDAMVFPALPGQVFP